MRDDVAVVEQVAPDADGRADLGADEVAGEGFDADDVVVARLEQANQQRLENDAAPVGPAAVVLVEFEVGQVRQRGVERAPRVGFLPMSRASRRPWRTRSMPRRRISASGLDRSASGSRLTEFTGCMPQPSNRRAIAGGSMLSNLRNGTTMRV